MDWKKGMFSGSASKVSPLPLQVAFIHGDFHNIRNPTRSQAEGMILHKYSWVNQGMHWCYIQVHEQLMGSSTTKESSSHVDVVNCLCILLGGLGLMILMHSLILSLVSVDVRVSCR